MVSPLLKGLTNQPLYQVNGDSLGLLSIPPCCHRNHKGGSLCWVKSRKQVKEGHDISERLSDDIIENI